MAPETTTIDPWEVLPRALEIYRERADLLLPMSLGVAGVAAVARGAGPPAFLAELLASALFAGAAVQIAYASVQPGADGSVRVLARGAVRALLPVVAVAILEGIVLALGIVVLLGAFAATLLGATGVAAAIVVGVLLLIPGVVLATRLAVVVPVAVLERTGVGAAFGRSWKLVRGRGWRVLGTLALVWVPLGLLTGLAGVLGAGSGSAAWLIVSTALATLTRPIGVLLPPVLYFGLLESSPALDAGAGDAWTDPQADAA